MTALNEIEEALKAAHYEFNAIRARDGAPQHIDWYQGRPLQTSSCTHEYWDEMTEKLSKALTKLAALREDFVMVPREPNAFILMEMQEAFDPRSLTMMHAFEKSYKAMIAAATTEKPNDKT